MGSKTPHDQLTRAYHEICGMLLEAMFTQRRGSEMSLFAQATQRQLWAILNELVKQPAQPAQPQPAKGKSA